MNDSVDAPPVCPRHPDRVAYVRCQRCGRPACPECQRPAAVGIQCVDCVQEGARSVRTPTTRLGAPVTDGRPLVTYTIIGLCVALFIGQQISGRVTDTLAFSGISGYLEPWRFVTVAFVHSPGFFFHILMNMYVVWILGQYLEPLMGRARFVALYLISAVGGSVGYLVLAGDFTQWTVGASGAVFGLFGALLVLNRHLGRSTGGIVVVLVINGVLGFVIPNIAWQAHLGGGLTGAAIAGVLAVTAPRERRRWQWPALTAVLVLTVVLAVVRYAMVGLL